MRRELFFIVFHICSCGSLGYSNSCYFCMGTPSCVDPIDYSEVWPRNCLPNSVCLKYITSSKNQKGEAVSHSLFYRRCYPKSNPDEDTCAIVKANEAEAINRMNHTLTQFECDWCDSTNCNSVAVNMSSLWTFVSLCVICFIIS